MSNLGSLGYLICSLVLLLQALWTHNSSAVVYPCHAVIVTLQIQTGEQRFFTGHTDKVDVVSFQRHAVAPSCSHPSSLMSHRCQRWRSMGAAPCWPRHRKVPWVCCAYGTSPRAAAWLCSKPTCGPCCLSGTCQPWRGCISAPVRPRKRVFLSSVFLPKFEPYHQAALVFRTCNCKWQVLQRGSFSMLLLRDKAGVNYSSPSAACVSQQVCWQLTPQHSPSPAFACFDSQLRCVGGVRCSPSPGVPPVLAASPTAEPFSVALERTGMAKR